ncbi:MAG: patatin-like phospholipase family protein, partial [Alphaproteobacteria bacterium]|nr:patatin-like phospholipase family protein [Alphaproteobacteria bacterium]
MTSPLIIAAGPTAYEHIKKNGLSPDDISAVFGASGAA